ncbi:MAG: T9SS type A sorting domain-containing protein [Ignavibacteriaceae bacterium]|nr:T9SS type A sorting domain-containing protein [Ignavibacteriaceae bacterium]
MHYLRIPLFIFLSVFSLFPQTSQRYFETFDVNNESGWSFIAADANISIQNGRLQVTSPSDDIIYIFPPLGATKDNFSFKVRGGEGEVQGGGFGRVSFKAYVGIHIEDDTAVVMYTNDIQSYVNPQYTVLGKWQLSSYISSFQLDGVKSGNNLLISAYMNDTLKYSGEITNADEGLFYGQMYIEIIKGSQPLLWSLDEIDIRYNPYISTPGTFYDDFNNPRTPWFRFGDFETIGQGISVSDGKLKFNYAGTTETAMYVIPPVGSVKDFSVEIEGGAAGSHNAPFGLSRFFDYKNYITFNIEEDSIEAGYAINSYEPVFIASAYLPPSMTNKLKFAAEHGVNSITLKAWINDTQVLTGTINNPPERLRSGVVAMGYDRGDSINIYLNYASLTYNNFLTSINEKISNPINTPLSAVNFPNPFSGKTVIRYQVPVAGHVTLKLYDLLGREIVTLYNGKAESGEHSLEWHAGGTAPGIYFYELRTDKESIVRKLVLIR